MEIPGYRIEREIGKGGMATVYLAIQESLDRSVVLKVLDKAHQASGDDMTQRFIDEGRIIASLHHPNIVTIYDIGIAGDDLYISMEYVKGGDLKKRMISPITPKTALYIVEKIGSALASAHSRNVIHRDVKPANILFKDDETPLLTDFGIAKQTDHDKDLTSTGIFLGSPNYVSPEQADGKNVDGRTDIYSLGCIFYEMLTGYKPYHSDSVIDIVIQHKTSPVPKLPDSLALYQSLLNRMMAKTLNERFTNAEEMIASIKKLQAKENNKTAVPDFDITGQVEVRPEKEKPGKKSMVVLLVLLCISAVFFFGLQFVEIRIKRSEVKIDQVTTDSVLPDSASPVIISHTPQETAQTVQEEAETTTQITESVENIPPVSEEITRALAWLGKQSLDEYKLTYPPKDNAYYYYSRLLEIQPGNRTAYEGILAIAERYAVLAERSLANNEIDKTQTYINIGLQIDPQNKALLSLQSIIGKNKTGIWDTIKSLF